MCLFLVKVAFDRHQIHTVPILTLMGEALIVWREKCPAKRAGFIAAYPTMDAVSAWLVPAAVNGVYQIDDLDEWLHGGIDPRCHQPTDRCDLRAKINLRKAGHED